MFKISSVVLLALMIASPVIAAFPTVGNRNTLKGIKTVCVEANVIWVAEQASKYNVTSSSLKSRVEGKLKEAGIRVAPLLLFEAVVNDDFLRPTPDLRQPTERWTIAGYPFFACPCGTGEMKKERK